VCDEAAVPKFILDAMLGRLAKSLRMLGYDASYDAGIDDASLKLSALREARILLTRDREIASAALPVRVVLIESDHHEEQLRQVVEEVGLSAPCALFTRCLICNVPVDDAPRSDVEGSVPPYVFATQERFARCPRCGRVYWPATHVAHATEWLADVLATARGSGAPSADSPTPGSGEGGAPAICAADATVRNVFVTGRPGVGKTTLIRRVLDSLGPGVGGFYTHEIREGGRRVGFAISDLRGDTGILAHVGLKSPYRVGKYGVNREDLERVGVRAVLDAVSTSRIVVMDEIGRMELCSEAFQEAVVAALDSPKPVLGTLQDRHNLFLDAVRARADVEVLRLTEENRDSAAMTLLERIRTLTADGGP
jgi:nucleoside-triphosphatase